MDTADMHEETVCEIYYRLDQLMSALFLSGIKQDWFGWYHLLMWGYFQTEHGIEHPCGEDFSNWREQARAAGIDVPDFESQRSKEQRRMYAELMAPKLVQDLLAHFNKHTNVVPYVPGKTPTKPIVNEEEDEDVDVQR